MKYSSLIMLVIIILIYNLPRILGSMISRRRAGQRYQQAPQNRWEDEDENEYEDTPVTWRDTTPSGTYATHAANNPVGNHRKRPVKNPMIKE